MLRRIVGTAQHYPWGDHRSIPQLFGQQPDGRSWAEMWFGTHHIAPSHLDSSHGPLLSESAGDLDMLVKLLAAGQPLSLQTHPTKVQAQIGFERENALGIDIGASNRMYKDASDKPEVLIALSPFEALCGFQDRAAIVERLRSMQWNEEVVFFERNGIKNYLKWCFTHSAPPSLDHCPEWLVRIADLYPNDPGLRVAPLLHHVTLSPGQAIVLPAGNLHAYIHGLGLEVMNSSDNVVRAGFTNKHIDVDELLALLDTTPLSKPVLSPNKDGFYPSPSDAFSIQRIDSDGRVSFPSEPYERIIFGPLNLSTTGNATTPTPGMYYLAAHDTGELTCLVGDSVWVCRQN